MESIIGIFRDFFANTSPRLKIISALFMIFGITISFIVFEAYTSHFSLNRMSKEVDILEKLVTLRGEFDLTESEKNLIDEYVKGIRHDDSTFSITGLKFKLSNFLWGTTPWILLGFSFLTMEGEKKSSMIGAIAFSVIYGSVAGFVPVEGV